LAEKMQRLAEKVQRLAEKMQMIKMVKSDKEKGEKNYE
jgi:hypothetical protein